MNRLNWLTRILGLLLVILTLVSCGSTASPAATATTPATPTPAPTTTTEVQIPTTQSEVPRISVDELKDRLDRGEAILVVDARAASAYEIRRIAGAVSVPSSEVESRLDELPRDQDIVFY